jgi:hypothetical protein
MGGFRKKLVYFFNLKFCMGGWGCFLDLFLGFRKKDAHFGFGEFCMRDFGSKQWKKLDKLNTGWNGFGNFVGIVWELFGTI